MPWISFAASSIDLKDRVDPIAAALKSIADDHRVSFFIQDRRESGEEEPVVVNDEVVLEPAVEDRVRRLATVRGLTIYVNPDMS